MKTFSLLLNYGVLLLIGMAIVTFVLSQGIAGYLFALIMIVVAWGVWKQDSWAYFSTAVIGLACFQLAKQGYQFQSIKHWAMSLGILVIPVAIFLHEQLAKQKTKTPNGNV